MHIAPRVLAHSTRCSFSSSTRANSLDKSTLMAAVWPKAVVEENNLNQHISALRRVLGERPDEHHFIVTIPGRGYRFVATVRPITPESGLAQSLPTTDRAGSATTAAVPPALQATEARERPGNIGDRYRPHAGGPPGRSCRRLAVDLAPIAARGGGPRQRLARSR